MNHLKQKIKEHKLAIAVSIVCGLVYFFPYLFFVIDKQSGFSGIHLSPLDSELHYMARVDDFKDAYSSSNANIFEYNNAKQINYQYSEQFYGSILRYTGISVKDFYFISKLIFPIINFFLWYYFSWLILKSKRTALLSASFLFFGIFIVDNLSIVNQLAILFWSGNLAEPLTYGRFVNPMLTFPFFFLGLILLYRFYDNPNLKNALLFSFFWWIEF